MSMPFYSADHELHFQPSVERVRQQFDAADGLAEADEWLRDEGFDAAAILKATGGAKLVNYTCDYGFNVGAEGEGIVFTIVHGEPNALAIPIVEQGEFVDLLLLDLDTYEFDRATKMAFWLGRDQICGTVRLHTSPGEWLQAACAGVCHIEPVSRRALVDLQRCEKIICDDVRTALDAWEWGFSGRDEYLSRFEIDAPQEDVDAYFEAQGKLRARLATPPRWAA
jgi:hypothetical protein